MGVTTRVLASLEEFNPYSVDLDTVPVVREGAPTEMYIHDWVVPQPGMQRIYEVQMREAFMKMLEMDAIPMKTWGGFETVAGGGRVPLSLMVTWIADAPGDHRPDRRGQATGRPGARVVDARGAQAARHVDLAPRPERAVVAHELTPSRRTPRPGPTG